MTDPEKKKHGAVHQFFHKVEFSAIITVIGIILLFSCAVIVTLVAPQYVDPTWTSPTSPYQVQMYEFADHNIFISQVVPGENTLQAVYRIKKGGMLLAFHETDGMRMIAPPNLEKYITKYSDAKLKLTSDVILLRRPKKTDAFDAPAAAAKYQKDLVDAWLKSNPDWEKKKLSKPSYEIMELYTPNESEAFSIGSSEGILDNWVDKHYYVILDDAQRHPLHEKNGGVVYINNPQEYRVKEYTYNDVKGWRYDPEGEPISNFDALKKHPLGFHSRAELIAEGEHIYAIEGCWYCHTDQTRTLVQDVVLNGSDSFPAPPSSSSEYIYQQITFPGTRRIGPDLSRVGIKRPSRDWHKGHFWSPKTASKGSIMPAFRHFFDTDPRGTSKNTMGLPNYRFEAVYQYLMTKGTRITPPTQAWWMGKDPIRTKEIIEGEYVPAR